GKGRRSAHAALVERAPQRDRGRRQRRADIHRGWPAMIEGLAPGERVLWEGRPQGIRGFLRSFDLFIIGFAAFAALFFVTAIAGSASSRQLPPAPSEVASVALFPFIAVGLMFLLPRVIMVTRESNGASYVVTDRRVILRTGRRRVELDLRTLPYLELGRS